MDDVVLPEIPQWRMRVTHWIPKATITHSEYVMFMAFIWQQLLHEPLSLLGPNCISRRIK